MEPYYLDQNFSIKDGLAYTEDKVLIHKIFIYRISAQITTAKLKEYFSGFGEILNIKLSSKRLRSNKRRDCSSFGFIHFKDSTAAANVLKQKRHNISPTQCFNVKACFSWQQPSVEQLHSDMGTDVALNCEGRPLHIYDLNDYCLEVIFRNLELKDRVFLAQASKRFADVFVSFFKNEYKSFNASDLITLTLWQRRIFLNLMGEHITEIKGRLPSNETLHVVDFITENCTNVQKLNLHKTPIKYNKFVKLLDSLQDITELGLGSCELTDTFVCQIKKLKSLEKLSLERNEYLNGQHINKMKSLKRLNLYSCSNITPSNFISICKSLNLRELDVRLCDRLGAFEFKTLADFQNELEVLKLDSPIYYEHILKLPALKTLMIDCEESYVDDEESYEEFFDLLAKNTHIERLKLFTANSIAITPAEKISCLKQLKELQCPNNDYLDDACLRHLSNLENLEILNISQTAVTDQGLLQLMKNCKKLRHIEVESCPGITNKLYREAIGIMKTRGDLNAKVEIRVHKSNIDQFTWNAYEDDDKHYVKLNFNRNPKRPEDSFAMDVWSDGESEFESDDDDFDDEFDDRGDHFFMFDSDGEMQPWFYDDDLLDDFF